MNPNDVFGGGWRCRSVSAVGRVINLYEKDFLISERPSLFILNQIERVSADGGALFSSRLSPGLLNPAAPSSEGDFFERVTYVDSISGNELVALMDFTDVPEVLAPVAVLEAKAVLSEIMARLRVLVYRMVCTGIQMKVINCNDKAAFHAAFDMAHNYSAKYFEVGYGDVERARKVAWKYKNIILGHGG